MLQYVTSPMFKVSRLDANGRLTIHAGIGATRGHFSLDGEDAPAIARYLLSCTTPTSTAAHAAALVGITGLSVDDADLLVKHLVEAEALIDADRAVELRQILSPWHTMGWGDAGNFHLATYNLPFDPDVLEGLSYPEYYAKMLTADDAAGPQPQPTVSLTGRRLVPPAPDSGPLVSTIGAVLQQAAPINRFEGAAPSYAEFHAPMMRAFGVQRSVGGSLGEHHLRSYPSGGARHPFELYVVSKGVDGLAAGIYQVDPVSGQLAVVGETRAAEIDTACFGKGGILSASIVLVLTCRWLRHSWKYRYARSYRMLLLEVGHIVQAINVSMLSYGLQAYHCPSIDDRLLRDLLSLDDDCAEGPVYALGIGKDGVR